MENKKLKNKLKIYRVRRNLTQEALALKIGVSRKTINVIEGENYSPSVTLALQIAENLDVNVNEIFYLEKV